MALEGKIYKFLSIRGKETVIWFLIPNRNAVPKIIFLLTMKIGI